jgi:phosphatidylserine/phosphatidylglycerophosphate/cardiolipin synthase-like enzyme
VGPGVHVVSVGRLGRIGNNASDAAILAMLGSARRTIYLSQQDLGPVMQSGIALSPWPEPILRQLSLALARGVDVYLVLSNMNATAGGLGSVSAGYSNGYTPAETAKKIADYARSHASDFPAGTNFNELLCNHLHVAPLRASSDNAWPDGTPLANHTKVIVVDDLAFYVGSQNLYPANLAEYGYLVDDAAAAAAFTANYWTKAWASSARLAVTGSEATTCAVAR